MNNFLEKMKQEHKKMTALKAEKEALETELAAKEWLHTTLGQEVFERLSSIKVIDEYSVRIKIHGHLEIRIDRVFMFGCCDYYRFFVYNKCNWHDNFWDALIDAELPKKPWWKFW